MTAQQIIMGSLAFIIFCGILVPRAAFVGLFVIVICMWAMGIGLTHA